MKGFIIIIIIVLYFGLVIHITDDLCVSNPNPIKKLYFKIQCKSENQILSKSKFLSLVLISEVEQITTRDVHYGTFRGSGIFLNLYFESRISNPIPE